MSQTKNKGTHPKDVGRKPSIIWFSDDAGSLEVDHAKVKPGWVWYVKDGGRGYIPSHRVEEVARRDV